MAQVGSFQSISKEVARAFERPLIAGFIVSKHVGIAVVASHTEIHGVRPVPLVFHRLHEQHGIAEPKLNGPLVGFVTGIALNLKLHGA